jgi:hypothetical protein
MVTNLPTLSIEGHWANESGVEEGRKKKRTFGMSKRDMETQTEGWRWRAEVVQARC